MLWRFGVVALTAMLLIDPTPSWADDSGTDGSAEASITVGTNSSAASGSGTGSSGSSSSQSVSTSLVTACDGSLCDTTTGSECGVAVGVLGRGPVGFRTPLMMAVALILGLARRQGCGAWSPGHVRG
jgi:hypothetical protein